MVKNLLPAMQEIQVRALGQEDSLEKEAATHSSTHAWRIPSTEEPGRWHTMQSQRLRHDSETKATTVLCTELGTGTSPLCSNKYLIPSTPAMSKGSVRTHTLLALTLRVIIAFQCS